MKVLTYKYTMNEELKGDLSLLEDAAEDLKESLDIYRCLAELTEKTYLYANSMQTPQRKSHSRMGKLMDTGVSACPSMKRISGIYSACRRNETGDLPERRNR